MNQKLNTDLFMDIFSFIESDLTFSKSNKDF